MYGPIPRIPMNNDYVSIGVYLLCAVTVYHLVDAYAEKLGAPAMIRTYLGIGIAIGGAYLWQHRQQRQ